MSEVSKVGKYVASDAPDSFVPKVGKYVATRAPDGYVAKIGKYIAVTSIPIEVEATPLRFDFGFTLFADDYASGSSDVRADPLVFAIGLRLVLNGVREPPFDCLPNSETTWAPITPPTTSWACQTAETTSWVCSDEIVEETTDDLLAYVNGDGFAYVNGDRLKFA